MAVCRRSSVNHRNTGTHLGCKKQRRTFSASFYASKTIAHGKLAITSVATLLERVDVGDPLAIFKIVGTLHKNQQIAHAHYYGLG